MVAIEAQRRRTHPTVGGYRLCAVDLDARPAAVIRVRPAHAALAGRLPGLIRRLDGELQRQQRPAVSSLFVRHIRAASGAQVELGYLVHEPIEDSGEVVASGLPGGPAIMALDVRPDELEDAHDALWQWLSVRGFQPSAAGWQCLRDVPAAGLEHAIVDIVMPYRWR